MEPQPSLMMEPVDENQRSNLTKNHIEEKQIQEEELTHEDEEEEEEEEEEEPRLKYQRLGPTGSDVAEILASDVASCFCVSELLLAIGMHSGSVYLLSCAGDKVMHWHVGACGL